MSKAPTLGVTVLTQPDWHPFEDRLTAWIDTQAASHRISRCTSVDDLPGGDVLFILSFHERVPRDARDKYGCSYVPHASALPAGRGWSPMEWQICEGAREITISLIHIEDEIDTGDICAQRTFSVPEHELRNEIEDRLFEAELELMDLALVPGHPLQPRPQVGNPSYYRRRTPADSALDPNASLASQFDLLRVADYHRFPAYMDLRGHRYVITIEKREELS